MEPIDPSPRAEEKVDQVHLQARLKSAIQRLPLAYRQMIALMLEDLSHAEIAEVLGITENNVAVRLNRARKEVREILRANS